MSHPLSPPLPLISRADRDAARRLVESCDLRFLENFDDLMGIFEDGRLVGCGARAGRVLEMLVVAPEHRGGGLVGEIVGELMRRGCEAGCTGFFIFTRPCTAPTFARLGFKPLVEHEKAVLLEHGNGLLGYLRGRAALARSGSNGAVVINADPFSLGHQYLVECAAARTDTVYVLVPNEGRFVLPLVDRLELARRGTAHIPNAVVTDAGPYVLGPATVPAYFLKPGDQPDQVALEIDADLFGRHIAPFLNITTRIVGTEPLDPATRSYNQALFRRLSKWGLRLVEIERKKIGDRWINTAHVHNALARSDWREVEAFVPLSTLAFLNTLKPGSAQWRAAA
jgi:[citrate (pro-3S)-lyase] ligase